MDVDIRHFKDIGQYLREVREASDWSLVDVAQHLNIRVKYLEALEAGDMSVIPGKVYARGYLLNYAEFLQLDHVALGELFDRLINEQKKEVRYFVPAPNSRGYQPGMVVVGAALLIVILIYVYWYTENRYQLDMPEQVLVSPVPERLLDSVQKQVIFSKEPYGPPMPGLDATKEDQPPPAAQDVKPQYTEPAYKNPQRERIRILRTKELPWLR